MRALHARRPSLGPHRQEIERFDKRLAVARQLRLQL